MAGILFVLIFTLPAFSMRSPAAYPQGERVRP